jgi:hypothetical protein
VDIITERELLMKLLILIFLTFFIASNSSQAQNTKDMLTFDRFLRETKEKNFVKVLERLETSYGIKFNIDFNPDDFSPEEIEAWSMANVFHIKEINPQIIQFKILELSNFSNYDYLIFSETNKGC